MLSRSDIFYIANGFKARSATTLARWIRPYLKQYDAETTRDMLNTKWSEEDEKRFIEWLINKVDISTSGSSMDIIGFVRPETKGENNGHKSTTSTYENY